MSAANENEIAAPPAFVGWYRPGNRGRWRRACGARTERECSDLLHAYIEAHPAECTRHCATCVLPEGERP